MDGGHDGDAEIDEAALVAHAETAVLRHAALGDIEFAHHLDAGNDGGVPVLGDGRHGVVQHAVDAVLDGHFLVARFDVDIAGAPFERVEDGGIHQLDDGCDVAVGGGELVDRERLVVGLLAAHHVEREALGHLFEHALGLLGLLEQVGDLRQRGYLDPQLFVEQQRQFVDQVEVARIGQGDIERAVLRPQRHEVVPEHQVHGDRPEQLVVDGAFPQIDVLAPVPRGHRARLLGFGGRIEDANFVSSHKNLGGWELGAGRWGGSAGPTPVRSQKPHLLSRHAPISCLNGSPPPAKISADTARSAQTPQKCPWRS